jgi:hypothetical protein
MKIPRFNYERQPSAPSRLRWEKCPHPKWTRVFHIDRPFIRDSASSARRTIFAIVARPKVDLGGKVIRRILIFDNHPDSLRLVSTLLVRSDIDPAAPHYTSNSHVIVGLVIIMALGLAMIWPLL